VNSPRKKKQNSEKGTQTDNKSFTFKAFMVPTKKNVLHVGSKREKIIASTFVSALTAKLDMQKVQHSYCTRQSKMH